MKHCKKCKLTFDYSNFSKDKRQKDGYFYYCKACCKEKDKERYIKNSDDLCQVAKEHYSKNKQKVKNRNLQKTYGLSLEDFNKMREYQQYSCKICGIHEEKTYRGLFVDHCHESGKVRGLLCKDCNFMLGLAKDNESILTEAIAYLARSKE